MAFSAPHVRALVEQENSLHKCRLGHDARASALSKSRRCSTRVVPFFAAVKVLCASHVPALFLTGMGASFLESHPRSERRFSSLKKPKAAPTPTSVTRCLFNSGECSTGNGEEVSKKLSDEFPNTYIQHRLAIGRHRQGQAGGVRGCIA